MVFSTGSAITRRIRSPSTASRSPTSRAKSFPTRFRVDSIESMEVISGAPPAEYGGKTSVVIVATTRSGQGVTTPHGSVTTSYGSFGTSNAGSRACVWGQEVGKFHLRKRLEYRPVPRSAGIHGPARQGQRRESVRPRGLSTFNRRLDSPELRLQPELVPDAEFLDAENATPWSGLDGIGPQMADFSGHGARTEISSERRTSAPRSEPSTLLLRGRMC